MKYSVVIPCHNESEQTFVKCLESWKDQTVKPYEVIVVNDKGNKELGDIVKRYGFKYIYNETKGHHGRARNTGFKEATGDYIISCNADDYVELNHIEEVDKVNKGQDIILIGLKSFGMEDINGVFNYVPTSENTPYTSQHGVYSEPIHIINRKFLIDNNLFVMENKKTADVEWVLEVEKVMKTYTYVSKVLYHWNFNNKRETGKEDIVFYIRDINIIGGIETWIYEIAKKYSKNRNISLYYGTADVKQILRLEKLIKCIKYKGENIECNKVIFCYNLDEVKKIKAKEYILVIHGDVKETGMRLRLPKEITKVYAVSNIARDSFIETHKEQLDGIECETLYNPLTIEKPKRVLRLISATRLTEEKGGKRMIAMAKALREQQIPFTWLVFSNKGTMELDINGFVMMKPELNITDYMRDADYIVQLSNTESYGYSIVEALMLGIPAIVTNMPVMKEIGIIDGVNGYVIDFNLNNLDVNKIYNSNLKGFKYEQLESNDKYLQILGKETTSNYKQPENKLVKAILKYNDIVEERTIEPNEEFIVSKERAIYLNHIGYVEIQ